MVGIDFKFSFMYLVVYFVLFYESLVMVIIIFFWGLRFCLGDKGF